ncbi:hypothetical protein BC829DRAFT_421832 [Chytridium lagenaria]|nr:hypothetical protein BC829DRAFT_421832 [Chytridium lagenaria]
MSESTSDTTTSRLHITIEKKKTIVERMWLAQSSGQSIRSFAKDIGNIAPSQLVQWERDYEKVCNLVQESIKPKFTLNTGPKRKGTSDGIKTFVIDFVEGRIYNEEHCSVKQIALAVQRTYPEFFVTPTHKHHRVLGGNEVLSTIADPENQDHQGGHVETGQNKRISSWVRRTLIESKYTCNRRVTHVAQSKSITELEIEDFRQFVPGSYWSSIFHTAALEIWIKQITTIAKTGSKNIPLRAQKKKGAIVGGRATSSLTVIGDGVKLKPMVVFHGTRHTPGAAD